MSTVLKQVDPATGVTELGYNRYIMDKVIEKLYTVFDKIENTLNLKIEVKLELTAHGHLSINAISNRIISNDVWINSKVTEDIVFNCSGFSFNLPNPHRPKISILFNKYFDIEFIHFTCMSKKVSFYEKIDVTFDKNIELQSIKFNPAYPKTNVEFLKSRKNNTLLSFYDEVILFQLSQNTSVEIKELLPEYYMPSAYNFQSEDFKDRLAVYEMMMA